MLRPYQQDALSAIRDHAHDGVSRQLIVMATGLGKTVVAAHVPQLIGLKERRKRALFLVHRDELAYQACAQFQRINPDLHVGMEKAQHRVTPDADIVVASVQTLGHEQRRNRFAPEDFALVQVDESHHLSRRNQQWLSVLRHFRVLKGEPNENRHCLLTGWTATPGRADNEGLEVAFDKISFTYDLRNGIKDGYLVPIQAFRAETEVDLSEVRTTAGDFNLRDLERTVNTPERNELIAREYLKIQPPGPSLFFVTDICHAHDLADTLQRRGVRVYPLSGKIPEEERRRLVDALRNREIDGISSCGIFNEGVDVPAVVAGWLCRPTKSGLLMRQQIGRILRPCPAPEELEAMRERGERPAWVKDAAIIVDFADVTGKHQLCTVASLFGLRRDYNPKGHDLLAQVDEIEQLELEHPHVDLRQARDIDALRTSLRTLDLLAPPQIPSELRDISNLSWLKEPSGVLHLGLMDGTMLSVRENTLGQYELSQHVKGIRSLIYVARDLKEAVARAERDIPMVDRKTLAAEASWKKQPPSDAQIRYWHVLDPKARREFRTWQELRRFVLERYEGGDGSYSRGAISSRIDALQTARQ